MYYPIPSEVTIKKSPINGLGLYTVKDIESGHKFGISHVEDSRFSHGYVRTPLGGFVNHSETPNAEIICSTERDMLELNSIKEILSGEEVTVKYWLYDLENNNE